MHMQQYGKPKYIEYIRPSYLNLVGTRTCQLGAIPMRQTNCGPGVEYLETTYNLVILLYIIHEDIPIVSIFILRFENGSSSED